jgi:hypothetical protein
MGTIIINALGGAFGQVDSTLIGILERLAWLRAEAQSLIGILERLARIRAEAE